MKVVRTFCNAASVVVLALAAAFPLMSGAHEAAMADHPPGMEMHAQWTKTQFEREANWLEIKASQQPAWDAYVAAHIDLLSTFENAKQIAADADASTATRQHAERAEAFAQSMAKVADATDKLQSVLDENQRKVLNRIVRMHEQFHRERFARCEQGHDGMPGHRKHESDAVGGAKPSKPSPKDGAPKN